MSKAADKQRRYRERRILGIQLVTVEIDQDTAENLVARGLVRPEHIGDSEALGCALAVLARQAASAADRPSKDRIRALFGGRPLGADD